MKKTLRIFVTLLIVGIAIALVGWRYRLYLTNPWTRDGQVRANVVQVAPRVSGPVVELPITDNQLVKAGQLLFRIDPRTYANSLEQAKAQYEQQVSNLHVAEQQVETAKVQIDISEASVDQAQSKVNETEADIEKNKAEWERQQNLLPQRATSQKSVEWPRPATRLPSSSASRHWPGSLRPNPIWPTARHHWQVPRPASARRLPWCGRADPVSSRLS